MSVARDVENGRDRRRKPAVMADVAKLAGVSHQTVSRVINESSQVRPETRDRVLAAMRMLDYRPNTIARALVTGRSRTLGVVTFDTTLYGPASTLFGIERAAHEAGYFVSIVSLRTLDRESFLGARRAAARPGRRGHPGDRAADRRGALRAAPARRPGRCGGRGRARPRRPGRRRRPVRGRRRATHHLLELGHRTVWHVAGPEDWLEAQQRIAGWREVLQAAAAELPPIRSATGARAPATRSGSASPSIATSPRSSSPTTRWRSGSCARCTRRVGPSPATSASSASTTSPRPRTSRRR